MFQGYLAVRGTGYRKERKGNPLPNIFRQWCDAKEVPCIVIEQVTGEEQFVPSCIIARQAEEQDGIAEQVPNPQSPSLLHHLTPASCLLGTSVSLLGTFSAAAVTDESPRRLSACHSQDMMGGPLDRLVIDFTTLRCLDTTAVSPMPVP